MEPNAANDVPTEAQPAPLPPVSEIAFPQPEQLSAPPRRPPSRATYALMAINVIVYLMMILIDGHQALPASGWHAAPIKTLNAFATPAEGTFLDLFVNADVFLTGQWWRLISAMFMHLGPLHIATNLWCLWNLGLIGEPLLGSWGLVAVYLLTGLGGNILSAGSHPQIASLGASGAVMGLAGVLVGLLRTRWLPIPPGDVRGLRRSVLLFALLNLAMTPSYTLLSGLARWFGLAPLVRILPGSLQIDDMAHLGGFLAGVVIGRLLVPRIRLHRTEALRRQRRVFPAAAAILLVTVFALTWLLHLP